MTQLPCHWLSWPLANRHLLGVVPSTFTTVYLEWSSSNHYFGTYPEVQEAELLKNPEVLQEELRKTDRLFLPLFFLDHTTEPGGACFFVKSFGRKDFHLPKCPASDPKKNVVSSGFFSWEAMGKVGEHVFAYTQNLNGKSIFFKQSPHPKPPGCESNITKGQFEGRPKIWGLCVCVCVNSGEETRA